MKFVILRQHNTIDLCSILSQVKKHDSTTLDFCCCCFVFFYFHCFPCYLLHTSCLPFCSAILKQRLSSWIKFFFYYCWLYQWTRWYCLFACFKLWKWLSSNLKDSKLWCCLLLHNLPMTDIYVDMLYVSSVTKYLQTSSFPSSDLEHPPLPSLWVSFILLKQKHIYFYAWLKGKSFPKRDKTTV